ncbi:cation-transporting atpase, partial [Tubulinosema ratisbonensis]
FFVLAYPGLPTSLMFGVSLAQQRLFKKGILCFDKERINTAGLINLIVFDKTGTLTEEGLDVCLIDKMYAEANVKKEEEESEESVKEIEAPTFETEILVKEDNSPKTIYETGSTCEQNIDYVEKMECFEQDFYKEMDNEEFNDYFCSGEEESEEKLVKNENEVDLMDIGMAVCHGAIKYNEEVVGDPLDVKMFVHSKGEMSNDKIVKLGELEIKIIKVVDFNAKVRRMSVLVSFRNRIFIFTKGSPEAIKELLKEISEDYDDRVGEYAMDGYRVISMACLEINSNGKLIDFDSKVKFNKNDKKVFLDPGINFDLNSLNYNTIENYTHKLLGVLVFANTIKPESQGVISELMKANIGCLMATGDNILTSISVANELGILEPEVPLIFPALQEDAKSIYDIEWISVGDEEIIFDKNKLIVYKKNEKINNYLFNIAIEGKEYEFLKQDKNYFDLILEKGKIFARMNPEQKKMLVEDLQNRNVRVCFCGDGANDMAALKEADVGIALAQNEASVASSFTSLITNISAVTTVLKEGRCALISSFSTFKYFFIIIILQFFFYYGLFYFFFNIVSDFQSLHTDLLGTLIISMFVNNLPPGKALSSKKIHDTFFTKKTIRHVLITLIYCLLIISLPFVYCDAPKNFNNESSSLATSLFFIFCTQIIVLGYFFNEGKPHRKCRNRHVVFIIYLSLFTLFTFFLFVSNGKNIICRYFKLVKLPNDILEEKISIKPKKVYIPSFRSGGYAILKVLSEEDGLTKSQISVRGKFYCDTEFNSKLQYSAFSSIKTLLKKKLVFTEGKPIKYFLTELGKEISQKLPQNNTVIEKEDKIKLLIDSREMKDKKSRDFFQKELEKEGLILETCNLEVGDFVWLKNDSVLDLIIERKKGSDFVSSITDGRLKEQMERLKNSGISKIFYLIEGLKSQDMNQNENFIKSVLSDIKKKEITVVETENINESIRFILQVDKYLKYTEIKEACTYEEFISKNAIIFSYLKAKNRFFHSYNFNKCEKL